MRPIDADALMDNIKLDAKKAIEEDDKIGSFWLGYAAGLVIKEPTIQPVATETNAGDTIRRQQAIDVLSLGKEMLSRVLDDIDVIGTVREKYSWGLGLIESYINDINELPSAQPEPQEGHWIEGGIYRDVIECNCSECGQLMTTAATVRMNYCPNCGAKMKGAQNE